jgi:hypothetical protein
MIDQSASTKETSASAMSPQEAFVSLLIASARADGSVSPHEANQIEHVAAGMQLFRGGGYEMRRNASSRPLPNASGSAEPTA